MMRTCLAHDRIGREDLYVPTVGNCQMQCIQRPKRRGSLGHPLTRLAVVSFLNGNDVIQPPLTVATKQFLYALRVFLRQFAAPHLLCERGVELDLGEPAYHGSLKYPESTLGLFTERFRTVIGTPATVLNVKRVRGSG